MNYDKSEIREALTLDNIFELLQEWGGDPEYTSFGIVSSTICHNKPGEGSRKLYYYENSGLFNCYTGCGESFDIFQMVIKIYEIQNNVEFDLNDAVRWIAFKFGISASFEIDDNKKTLDWQFLNNYERIKEIELKEYSVTLNDYEDSILERLNYTVKIIPWLKEGMTQKALEFNKIGFYPGGDQITIPHYDMNGRFIGLRGRTLCLDEAEKFGKYRPVKINNKLYNHPLGMNLYNLNHSKDNIKIIGKAIIFESEKSCILYQSYFGIDNDISVACCGSNISAYQIQMLIKSGAKEIVVAFDRQFQKIGDNEHKHLVTNFKKLHDRYKNEVIISFIFDRNMITDYKASPIDEGPEKFLKLFKERVFL